MTQQFGLFDAPAPQLTPAAPAAPAELPDGDDFLLLEITQPTRRRATAPAQLGILPARDAVGTSYLA